MSERPHPTLYQVSTTATTRIVGWDAVSAAIGIAQTVFPATRPNAVLLTRPDYYPEALAATRLLHRPFDAALLYTEGDSLEEAVSQELVRLSPHGHGLPGQVIVIGSVHAQVLHDIAALGFTIYHLIGHDLWDTVDRIAELDLGVQTGDALLVSIDPLAGGVVAGAYSAHTGTPILFATEQGLFPSSIQYLRRHPKTRVFVVSPESYLPHVISSEIRHLGSKVEGWVGGSDAYEMAVRFAKFRHKNQFGWGKRERSAAAVTFVPIERWELGVSAVSLAHRGKQTPLLLTRRDLLPPAVEGFLQQLHPRHDIGLLQPHGFVVGSLDLVSYQVQMRIHRAMTQEGDPER
ncbi:MAG: cell wall-binding repeat-containing protein [Tumebacillaceae bacterium]